MHQATWPLADTRPARAVEWLREQPSRTCRPLYARPLRQASRSRPPSLHLVRASLPPRGRVPAAATLRIHIRDGATVDRQARDGRGLEADLRKLELRPVARQRGQVRANGRAVHRLAHTETPVVNMAKPFRRVPAARVPRREPPTPLPMDAVRPGASDWPPQSPKLSYIWHFE